MMRSRSGVNRTWVEPFSSGYCAAKCALISRNSEIAWLGVALGASLPNTLLLAVSGIDGRSLLPALDLAGIAISQGSACSSGSPLPPRVLLAMGLAEPAARSCVRVSFGRDDDRDSGARAGAAFAAVVQRLQKKN